MSLLIANTTAFCAVTGDFCGTTGYQWMIVAVVGGLTAAAAAIFFAVLPLMATVGKTNENLAYGRQQLRRASMFTGFIVVLYAVLTALQVPLPTFGVAISVVAGVIGIAMSEPAGAYFAGMFLSVDDDSMPRRGDRVELPNEGLPPCYVHSSSKLVVVLYEAESVDAEDGSPIPVWVVPKAIFLRAMQKRSPRHVSHEVLDKAAGRIHDHTTSRDKENRDYANRSSTWFGASTMVKSTAAQPTPPSTEFRPNSNTRTRWGTRFGYLA